jgi:signal transduction histidine kinase/ligand-binding sensor domain-containing protein/DNA-binding response OmpR family regulator
MLKILSKISGLIAALVLASSAVIGQGTGHPFYKFTHFSSQDGLPQNSVLTILQDNTGFLWFGTDDGLARYDGYNFTVYKHDPEDPYSISNNVIRGLAQDNYGFIWIATEGGGLNVYNPISEKFISLKHEKDPALTIGPGKVYKVLVDSEGDIWVATLSDGIIKISYRNDPGSSLDGLKENIEIRYYKQGSSGLNDNKIWSIHEDRSHRIWIGTYEGGLQVFDKTSETFTDYPIIKNQQEISSVKVFFEDSKGNIWIGTERYGLFKKNRDASSLKHYPLKGNQNLNGRNLPNITGITEDQYGHVWIGTLGDGLSVYDPEHNEFYHYEDDPTDPYSINGSSVYNIYEDKTGNIWIGMYSGEGLNKINPREQHFEHYRSLSNVPGSLSGKMVKSIYRDSYNNLWVGIFNGGLNLWDSAKSKFIHFNTFRNNISHNNVQCITEGKPGILWVGTDGGGLNKFDINSNSFTVYKADPNDPYSISKNEVWAICKDHQGYLWIGTANGGGLNRFNPKTGEFQQFIDQEETHDSPNFNDIRALYLDKKNYLWIGTFGGGLNKYDFTTGKFTYYTHDPKNKESISHDIITSIFEDSKGDFWIGTFGGGLNKFNPATEKFTSFREKDGLPSNMIKAILEDDQGYLWISTVKGLSRYNYETGTFKNFTSEDGLQSDEFNLGTAFKDKYGKLYFGGTNGFNAFYPDRVKIETTVKAPVITKFRVFNKPVSPDEKIIDRVLLHKNITHTSELELDHEHNSFEFEFSVLEYNGQDKLKYAYKLEGFDKAWIITDAQRRFAPYANLNAGDYTFKVKASNEHGVWGSEEKILKLIVHPPWWKSSIAYAIYVVLIALVLYAIKSIILFRIKLKNDLRFERLEHQKHEEINQLKLRFFTNISHELRTPLMLINVPLEQLVKRSDLSEKVQTQLSSIHNNATRLLRLINQLLDFRKQETGNMSLAVREENFIDFIRDITTSFEGLASQRNIHFNLIVEKKLDPMLWFDPDQLEKVFYNLCYNAFKFTPDGGKVEVKLFQSSIVHPIRQNEIPCLAISVIDNGKGIKPEYQDKIFERFFQINYDDSYLSAGTGIGLALSKNLVEFHKGSIDVFSIPEEETIFTVKLRCGKNHFEYHEFAHNPVKKQIASLNNQELNYLKEEFLKPAYADVGESGLMEKPVKGQKLLIVDDNLELLNLMKDTLGSYFHILTATHGREGLDSVMKCKPDLVISDIMMPYMDGVEMCARMKQNIETSHIPVILLTAKSAHSSKLEGYESGADDYLSKPFPLDLLIMKVKNLLKSRDRLKEKFRKVPDLEPTEITVASADKKLMKKAIEIVEAHMDNSDFDIPIFVKEVGLSRTLLYEKLKALTGHTPNGFIQMLRLKRAAQLLLSSDLKVAEIGYMVGFNNPKYFSKCFQKQFGCLPSRYAEKHQSVTVANEV